eukprot:scaffold415_cov124-Isochrysis_galbana.AAC.7
MNSNGAPYGVNLVRPQGYAPARGRRRWAQAGTHLLQFSNTDRLRASQIVCAVAVVGLELELHPCTHATTSTTPAGVEAEGAARDEANGSVHTRPPRHRPNRA